MIKFFKEDGKLILRYVAEYGNFDWIKDAIKTKGFVELKRTFYFEEKDILSNEDLTVDTEMDDFDDSENITDFLLGRLVGDYYKINKGILVNDFEIFIYKDVALNVRLFVADANVSVFNSIKRISKNNFYLAGNNSNAIPIEEFERLLKYFPTSYERRKYVDARISSILRNYLDQVKDAERDYAVYMNNKIISKDDNLIRSFRDVEIVKYQTIYSKLSEMLKNEVQYSERQWQDQILQIILLLYPKYIKVFKETPIKIKFSTDIKEKYLDLLLVDNNGNVDIIEIKKPFENAIMTKGFFRDNYIPLRELSGTVMQIEKYIYYLNRWSYEGEDFLSNKYKSDLPEGLNIKITNPNGIIIMGRENNLSLEQKQDFEVVKRKYKNIADIITYDNLLERLLFTIEQMKKL